MKKQQFKNTPSPRLVTALGALAIVGSATAQDLTGSYGSFSDAALQSAALEAFGEGFSEDSYASTAFEYFSFGVNVNAEYNDNIFLTDQDEVEDFIFRVSVPLGLSNDKDSENQWSLSYTPRFNFYADNSDQDGVDQFVDAGYRHVFAKTTVDLGLGYEKTDGADRFASGSIAKDAYKANLGVSHQYSGKSRFDLDLGFLADEFEDDSLFDRERYNARVSWQYQATGKIEVGPYVAYEHASQDGVANPDQDAISFGVRGKYQAFSKTTLIGYIGAEHRTFDGGDLDDKTSPTFEFGAKHQLTGKIDLTGMLYHNIRASYSDAGQSYTATGVNFFANYAATARISVNAGVSYEHDNYFETSSLSTAGDLDSDYVTLFLGGNYVMDNGFYVGPGLRYSTNDSEAPTRDFGNLIFNINAGYNF
ncbi:hypothetical protein ACFPK9_08655 [Rubritalea spongiae]|uniref:Outer membrane beta-barrel protein n=1 Tax=Rubritalea spongiae TaxID=430797 RepID=A0ABW5E1C6_9BACT